MTEAQLEHAVLRFVAYAVTAALVGLVVWAFLLALGVHVHPVAVWFCVFVGRYVGGEIARLVRR